MIVGPAGVMKTPALAEATKPLRRLEMDARKANETAMKTYTTAVDDHKLRAEAAQKRFKEALKKDPNAPPRAAHGARRTERAPVHRRRRHL